MRAVLIGCLACLALVSQADAEGKMTLSLGDSSPTTGLAITVVLRMANTIEKPRVVVIAVAPGRNWYDVVGTVTGASRLTHAQIPKDGYGIELVHVAGDRWRAYASFSRAGRWLLVVPNWGGAPGFAIPPPIMRHIDVSGA